MISSYSQMPDLSIAVGVDVSNILEGVHTFHDAAIRGIALYGKTVTDGAITYKLQAAFEPVAADVTTWYDVADNAGNVIVPPTEGECSIFENLAVFGCIRIKSSANVTSVPKVWKVNRLWTT